MSDKTLTKAELLEYLGARLRNSVIDDLIYFTVAEWQRRPSAILNRIVSFFDPGHLLIVRSSARDEDRSYGATAGYYHTEMGMSTGDRARLVQSINKVMESYARKGRPLSDQDQIVIQKQLYNAVYSGVILTRESRRDAPYYIIVYDDTTGQTNTVTKGMAGKTLWIAHWQAASHLPSPWNRLLLAIQELERFFPSKVLAVEFGIDGDWRIHTFQVRTIKVDNLGPGEDIKVKEVVDQLQLQAEQLGLFTSTLTGKNTILADMSDWNPAEMLGGRPNFLDYSLYRFLVTKSAWNQARVSLGYTDVAPAELMVRLADKPYIDARVSFNSLTPRGLKPDFQEALIDYYLDKLARNPALQDKVEFEIVLTCFDLSWEDKYPDLRGGGFSEPELGDLRQHLLSFTSVLLQRAHSIIRRDIESVQRLESLQLHQRLSDLHGLLDTAHQLLTNCRNLGVIPFARLARLAFVGLAILKNLLKNEIVTRAFFDGFLISIETVAKRMAADSRRLSRGEMSIEDFMARYGHLRPGTYNVTSPRYDLRPDWFTDWPVMDLENPQPAGFTIDETVVERIDRALDGYGLHFPARSLFDFARQAIEYREYAKFVFTKSVSDALEMLALAGEMLGFSRGELALLDLDTLMLARDSSLDTTHIRELWASVIDSNRERKEVYHRVVLAPVLTGPQDLVMVPYYECYPNYVTNKRVEGEICPLTSVANAHPPDVTDKIVLIESADPGYDWIFARRPLGLITKYGGAGSHMAVRCAEFGLPAAIGCGEAIFEHVAGSRWVLLDCGTEAIVPV